MPGLVTSQEASNGFNEASSSLVAATALEMSGLVKKNNKTRILVVGGGGERRNGEGNKQEKRTREKERKRRSKEEKENHTHTHTHKKKLIRRVVRAGRRHDQHSRGAIDSISGNATRRLQWHCRRRHPTLTEPSITTQ